jgi:hypothetical protein
MGNQSSKTKDEQFTAMGSDYTVYKRLPPCKSNCISNNWPQAGSTHYSNQNSKLKCVDGFQQPFYTVDGRFEIYYK